VNLNEIFQKFPEQSGDAWAIDGKSLTGKVKTLDVSELRDFLLRVAKRKCSQRLSSDASKRCQGKCFVGFKEFEEHLTHKQHKSLWGSLPNFVGAVLERNVEDRWRSSWVAYRYGDWDVKGNPKHKEVIANATVPPMNSLEANRFCTKAEGVLCDFGRRHKKWYRFVRKNLPGSRMVAVGFQERFDDGNAFAKKKIANALPRAFESAFLEEMGLPKFTNKYQETTDFAELSPQHTQHIFNRTSFPSILIGVTTNRKNFETRVAAITRTWGDARKLPPNVAVFFFVGEHMGENQYETGSVEDIETLAEAGGIVPPSKVIVLNGIDDDEYPLMKKASEILKRLSMLSVNGTTKAKTFDWIMDVDDDTYVNIMRLEQFVSHRDQKQHAYFGRRGIGRRKDRKFISSPYCMGGPGILFSRPTLMTLANSIDNCQNEAEKHGVPTVDDIIIGRCVHDVIGIGCSDGLDDDKNTFYQNTLDDLPDWRIKIAVSMHQFKEQGELVEQHGKFVDVYSS
jgi:chondroitin sulfate synthase